MAIAGFVMALWFAFDGLVTYPKKLEYAVAYEEIQAEVTNEVERIKRWRAFAESKGWPTKVPDKSAATIRNDIQGQYFFGVLCLVLGIPALIFYLRSRNQWVEGTEQGVNTSWGQQVNFADVTLLNKKKWDNKGIARAIYTEDGKQRSFVFDDFKFERQPLGQLLRRLEETLQPEQIVGGLSEAEKDLRKSKAAEPAAERPEEHSEDSSDAPAGSK